jgi:radical SAM superfamily enzyme YgiQ (UPF0313 family)
MKKILLLSFDLIREGEDCDKSYSIASMLANVKQHPGYEKEFILDHVSFNFFLNPAISAEEIVSDLKAKKDLDEYNAIFLSAYVWSEELINPLIAELRRNGFGGVLGLGGYQIRFSENLQARYPGADIFIAGYAETALLNIIKLLGERMAYPVYHQESPQLPDLPSPYLTGEIKLSPNQEKVRMETVRGCPNRCAFCAHRDLLGENRNGKGIDTFNLSRVWAELELFQEKKVRRVNVIDPTFNIGIRPISILEKIKEMEMWSQFTFQTRFEGVRGKLGQQFLDLCSALNTRLEFGLQTVQSAEFGAINRPNDLRHIEKVLTRLNSLQIPYEISLIYGLPHQTVDSFARTIDWLTARQVDQIIAFPLMLIQGTELEKQRDRFGFREKIVGKNRIPVVISSHSFSEDEWWKMKEMADGLAIINRYL